VTTTPGATNDGRDDHGRWDGDEVGSDDSGFDSDVDSEPLVGGQILTADYDAARAVTAELVAIGLAVQIDEVCAAGDELSAPDVGWWRDQATLAARASHDAAGAVRRLLGLDRPVDEMDDAASDACERADWVELATREIAQLGLGVTAFATFTHLVDRVERTCVAVLYPPSDRGGVLDFDRARPGLVDDMSEEGFPLTDHDRSEREVLLAGFLCRLLLDQDAEVELASPVGVVRFTVAPDLTLIGRFQTTPEGASASAGGAARAEAAGWARRNNEWAQSWETPVTVTEPVVATLDVLTSSLDEPAEIRIHAHYA
jgi:hypothetical protein